MSGMGTHGTYGEVWSTDIVRQDSKAVFVMLFGSWFGNWDDADDIMRAVLVTPTMGLACCMAGRPHWFFHHMGLGEPIGYSARLSMNNSNLYQNESNRFTRAVYIALMGDPTLRLDPVAPPAGLSASFGAGSAVLNWSASPDAVSGYHVYRAGAAGGPFSRLTASLVTATNFAETNPSPGASYYMVRAVKLQTNSSGVYFNPSQGVFAAVNVSNPASSLTLRVAGNGNALVLSWNSQSGQVYRVLSKNSLTLMNWTDVSGPIAAGGTNASWADTNAISSPQRFYRLASP